MGVVPWCLSVLISSHRQAAKKRQGRQEGISDWRLPTADWYLLNVEVGTENCAAQLGTKIDIGQLTVGNPIGVLAVIW
jgi:hypothetical protein